jgi:hypothetical protein
MDQEYSDSHRFVDLTNRTGKTDSSLGLAGATSKAASTGKVVYFDNSPHKLSNSGVKIEDRPNRDVNSSNELEREQL